MKLFATIGLIIGALLFADHACAQCSSTSYGNGVTCIQAAIVGGNNTNQTNQSVNFSPTAGHAVLVGAYQCWDSNCATTGTTTMYVATDASNPNPEPCFTKSPNSPFTLVETGGVSNQHLQDYIWFCSSIPSGVTAIYVWCSVAASCNYITFWVSEWTGLTSTTGVGGFDGDGGQASTSSGTTATCTAASAANSKDLFYGIFDNTSDESMTPGSPMLQINQGFSGNLNQGFTVTAAGVHTMTASWTGADDWYVACANIKSAASVAGPTNFRPVPGVDNEYGRQWWAYLR